MPIIEERAIYTSRIASHQVKQFEEMQAEADERIPSRAIQSRTPRLDRD
jgi:hypothetical protein